MLVNFSASYSRFCLFIIQLKKNRLKFPILFVLSGQSALYVSFEPMFFKKKGSTIYCDNFIRQKFPDSSEASQISIN